MGLHGWMPDHAGRPWQRSLSFAGGIVCCPWLPWWGQCPVGSFYGQFPVSSLHLVAVLAVVMGLNLLGLLSLPLPAALIPERLVRRFTFPGRPWPPWPPVLPFGIGSQPLAPPRCLLCCGLGTAQQAVP